MQLLTIASHQLYQGHSKWSKLFFLGNFFFVFSKIKYDSDWLWLTQHTLSSFNQGCRPATRFRDCLFFCSIKTLFQKRCYALPRTGQHPWFQYVLQPFIYIHTHTPWNKLNILNIDYCVASEGWGLWATGSHFSSLSFPKLGISIQSYLKANLLAALWLSMLVL